MKLFKKGYSLKIKFLFFSLCAAFLFYFSDNLKFLRFYSSSLTHNIDLFLNNSSNLIVDFYNRFESNSHLIKENKKLNEQLFLYKEKILRFDYLEKENLMLKTLLDYSVNSKKEKMLTEVVSFSANSNRHLINIKIGLNDGAYEGQTVIDESGIIGQISEVSLMTSQVIMLSDIKHAIPVSVLRNGVKAIAYGTGLLGEVEIRNISCNSDIKVGDKLISSGFGETFVEGYAVGEVVEVVRYEDKVKCVFAAKTSAMMDRAKYVAVIWSKNG